MSQFDVTIDPASSFQADGAGSAADATFEDLDGVRNVKAFKGVHIRNRNATAVALLVSYEGVAGSFKLAQGDTIFLEVRDPAKLRVAGDGDTVLYTWLAY